MTAWSGIAGAPAHRSTNPPFAWPPMNYNTLLTSLQGHSDLVLLAQAFEEYFGGGGGDPSPSAPPTGSNGTRRRP